ncbi:helix-turn-helix domain-containing protein [Leeia sp. TBRC 13508]|uniref:Helix-turn-helix domain-containing protein n=1 Tax=Leeia speluncae TaxID=2884804 RepID=A0ABS8DAA8_9NEIS|nr:helix-turn-helix transcriptional regulator [Leeia speluncae]MCB6185151.1 helix-turn-helix domain-containing protein [Leeia speluncae]
MRSAKKTPEELQALRRSLPDRLLKEQPDISVAAKMIREALGLSQEEFARLIQISKGALAKLEQGAGNPTLETLEAIAKPFNLRIALLPQTASSTQSVDIEAIIGLLKQAYPASQVPATIGPMSIQHRIKTKQKAPITMSFKKKPITD